MRALNGTIATLGVLAVILAAIAADQGARRPYFKGPPAAEGGAQSVRALAKVVGTQEPVLHETSLVESLHSNPVRGPNRERSQLIGFEILTGAHRGKLVVAENVLHFRPSANAIVSKGSLVNVSVQAEEGGIQDVLVLKPIVRFPTVLMAAAAFLVAVILFAGVKGVRICVSLAASAVLTMGVLMPALMRGYPPVLAVLAFALLLIGVTFVLVGEASRKGVAAATGALGGLISGLLLAMVMGWALGLSGLASTEAIFLQECLPEGVELSFADLVVAGCVVAILGIVIDVAISVASGMEKLFVQNPETTRLEATHAGLRMARDIMGTMLLTLVFAYFGVNIHVLMLPKALPVSLQELVNSEAFSIEAVRILCGSIGLLLTGPLTALSAGWLLSSRPPQVEKAEAGRCWRLVAIGIESLVALLLLISIVRGARVDAAWPHSPERLLLGKLAARPDEEVRQAGEEFAEAGRLDEAAITFWEAKRRSPEDATVFRELAYIYTLRQWFVVAEAEIDRALESLDTDSRTHYVAGVVKAWVRKYDEGEQHLRRAIELDPENELAKEALETMFGDGEE